MFWGIALVLAQGIPFEVEPSFDSMLERAKGQNKLLFVYFNASWCTGCPQMENEAFQDVAVRDHYAAAFVNAKYSQQSSFGERLAERYEVKSSPTFLFIDPATYEVVHRAVGIFSATSMMQLASIAQDPAQNLLAYQRRYEAGDRQPKFLYDFAYKVKQAQLQRYYLDLPDEYLNTQFNWQTTDNMQFIMDFTDRPNMQSFEILTHNRAAFYEHYPRQSIDQKIDDIIAHRLDELLSLRQVALQEEIFDKVQSLLAQAYPENAIERTYEFKMNYFKTHIDRERYAQAAIDYVDYMGKDISPTKLREMAFQFYHYIDDKELLKHAYKWSKRALRQEKSVPNYDAVCSVSYKLDRKMTMRRYIRKGIRYAKVNGESYDALAEIKRWSKDSQ